MKLTGELLNKICPSLKERADGIADVLNKVTPEYGMDKADILEEFIPNLLVECAEFTKFEENLNYSEKALIKLFSRKRISELQASVYGRTDKHKADPVKIANCIYGGEWGKKNLGNIHPNDGWDFRGAGAIQGTGRGIITDFTNWYNQKHSTTFTALEMASMMRDEDNIELSIHFACWFFSIAKKLIPLALADEFKPMVEKINGGYNGMDERSAFYERCKRYFV